MTTTALLIGTFAALLTASLAVHSLFLQLGSRWARIPNVTFFRAAGAIVAVTLVSWIPSVLLDRVPAAGLERAIFVSVLQIVLSAGLTWFIIARVLKTSMWRAIAAWLATLIPTAGFLLLTIFVVIPYLFEAFKIPTNAMAPTILGVHWDAPCPRCGSPAYASAEPERGAPSERPVLMICSQELSSCEALNPPRAELPGDRIIVNKLIRPGRWDIIVFRYPENPEVNFVFRLVGLPGETVVIRDGAVWIDGTKQSPPDACKGLEYLAEIEESGISFPPLWGSDARPARLGPDEYFVLGDFSARAKDSRLWQQGAPGHPPYAVPASYIVGVVTHIYWPPSRWRVLR